MTLRIAASPRRTTAKARQDVELGTSSPPVFSAEWRAMPTNELDLRQAARSPDDPVFDHLKLIAFRAARIAEVHVCELLPRGRSNPLIVRMGRHERTPGACGRDPGRAVARASLGGGRPREESGTKSACRQVSVPAITLPESGLPDRSTVYLTCRGNSWAGRAGHRPPSDPAHPGPCRFP